jgi:Leucine-rich repeat (LRR) protein
MDSACVGDISSEEYQCLQDLFESTEGENWLFDDIQPSYTVWNFPNSSNLSAPCSDEWQGLGCVSLPLGKCAIVEIWLNGRNLVGQFPPSIKYCSTVLYMSFSHNSLTGSIPSQFGTISSLRALYLDHNHISGNIPSELGNLGSVVELDFMNNYLSQFIPTQLGLATNLQLLRLYSNSLTSSIPSELANLKKLILLELSTNYLRHSIPTELGDMYSLNSLRLNYNHLTGPLPTQLGSMQGLELMYIYSNCLTGPIPTEYGNLVHLLELDLMSNLLNGTIPLCIWNSSSVRILHLLGNGLEGSLLDLSEDSVLSVLALGSNQLTGTIPSELARCESMGNLILSSNSFSGPIPSELGLLVNNRQLDLQYNNLRSAIPTELAALTVLQLLFLANNQLSGEVPLFSSSVVDMDLSNNYLHGNIDTIFVNCSRLRTLNLATNWLSGSLPDAIADCRALQSLTLSDNSFVGPIDILKQNASRHFEALQSIALDINSFSSTLPFDIFQLPHLQTLILNQNCFQGSIPSSICNAKHLQNLVLDSLTQNCGNRIPAGIEFVMPGFVPKHFMEGSIPTCLWNMSTLQVLRVLGNRLSGSLIELHPESQLTVVAVGSNTLTGTIPLSLQTHNFEQLDLSLNRFVGTLSDQLQISSSSVVYNMDVNRLSGNIPAPFYQQLEPGVLNVLDGNLFNCPGGQVPQSDVNHESYDCGSQNLESPFQNWLVVFGIFCAIGIASVFFLSSSLLSVDIKNLIKNSHFLQVSVILHASLFVVVVVFALMGYLVFKLPARWSGAYVTHTVQYWWTATVAFMCGWQVVLFVLILLTITSTITPAIILRLIPDVIPPEFGQPTKLENSRLVYVYLSILHLVNFVLVLAINGVYVFEAVNNVAGINLLLIQATLSLFKFVWSIAVAPMCIGRIISNRWQQLPHLVFINLFLFVGAPYLATLFESSSCFRGLLQSPQIIESSFSVPALTCSGACHSSCTYNVTDSASCKSVCTDYCQFDTTADVSVSMIQPWLYSYQCSSAMIQNYSPVLIIGYVMSGLLLPIALFLYGSSKPDIIVRYCPERLRTVLLDNSILCSGGEAAEALFKRSLKVQLVTNVGCTLMVKLFQNLTVFLTFGMASPLLAVAVTADGILAPTIWLLIIERYTRLCTQAGVDGALVRDVVMRSFIFDLTRIKRCIYIMNVFAAIFWSFFVFDMIGDLYSTSVAGLCTIAPLLLPWAALAFVTSDHKLVSSVTNKLIDGTDVVNPVISPQDTCDHFEVNEIY